MKNLFRRLAILIAVALSVSTFAAPTTFAINSPDGIPTSYYDTIKIGKSYSVENRSSEYIETYWFKFKVPKKNAAYLIKVDFFDENRENGFGATSTKATNKYRWFFKNYRKDGTEYYEEIEGKFPSVETKYYDKELMTGSVKKGEWCYIWITAAKNSGADFKVKEYGKPGKVSGIKASKINKKSMTIKWKKHANVTKWKVQYRKKGTKKWKTKTVKTNRITLKKLKRHARYQIRVKEYVKKGVVLYEINENWAIGYGRYYLERHNWFPKWSKIKTIKTK